MTAKQKKAYYNKVINKIVKDAKNEKSDIKKLKLIHDRLADRITYDDDLYYGTKKANEENYHKEGAILNGTAVCNGYAEVFQDVITKVGIKNKFIISEEMNHAWNQVKLGNHYYAIDLTWDDGGDDPSYNYYYFLLDNKTLQERGHEEYKPMKSEKATSTQYLIFSKMLNYPLLKEDATGFYFYDDNGIYGLNSKGKVKVFQDFTSNDGKYYELLYVRDSKGNRIKSNIINGNLYYRLSEDYRDSGGEQQVTIIKVGANLKKHTVLSKAVNVKSEFDLKSNKLKLTESIYDADGFLDYYNVINYDL